MPVISCHGGDCHHTASLPLHRVHRAGLKEKPEPCLNNRVTSWAAADISSARTNIISGSQRHKRSAENTGNQALLEVTHSLTRVSHLSAILTLERPQRLSYVWSNMPRLPRPTPSPPHPVTSSPSLSHHVSSCHVLYEAPCAFCVRHRMSNNTDVWRQYKVCVRRQVVDGSHERGFTARDRRFIYYLHCDH